jgi:diadenosine tetraphosphate (Ap4A) HIT family hydrolase
MIEEHSNCDFCKEIKDRSYNILKTNRIIAETQSFISFPAEGSFTSGYLLVVPKIHHLCFGELNIEQFIELNSLISSLISTLKSKGFDNYIIFEHGSRNLNKLNTKSIEHAHIHIIPSNKSILTHLPNGTHLKKITSIIDVCNENDNYLYIRDINESHFIAKNSNAKSQFFRKIYCEVHGMPSKWKWQKYPFKRNMKKTLKMFALE